MPEQFDTMCRELNAEWNVLAPQSVQIVSMNATQVVSE